ncbi:MAG: hypothetical protein JNM59_06625 [Hyphomonadaceae bacterium]|nr:hypothetical protein [Hyphomonadaceae bacterium]
MNLLGIVLARSLDAADICVEAASALWRVAVRGAFAPDAKSYRGARFAQLAAGDVFVQEIALNAADHDEAKKAVLLDAERLLPLSPEAVAFDIAGPVDTDTRIRSRPERSFVLGVIRKDALERLRSELPLIRRGGVEAFVHTPPAHPHIALLFEDNAGRRRRRLRRTSLVVAALVLAVSASDAIQSGQALLERGVADAEAERLAIGRRIRLAERQLETARAAQQTLAQAQAPSLGQLSASLERIARHQPEDADLSTVSLSERTLRLDGRAYAPDGAELALRRAFEGSELLFSAEDGEAPRAYEARLTLAEAAP